MRTTKIIFSILAVLSAYPVAFAQTADSAQNINNIPDRAPKTSIGQDNAQGSSAAQQSYEVRLDACPSGQTGAGVERTRKIYTRPNGSQFQEAWYVSKQDCRAVEDPRIADLQNTLRILSDRVVVLENKPQPSTGGATPIFTLRSGSVNGTTENGRITGYCVSSAFSGWSNYVEKDILIDGFNSGRGDTGPWPNWPGRQVGPTQWVGPICPAGMGFTQLSYTPQAPSAGE